MCYCIMEGDIDMVIKDWEDEWKIPVLTQEIPTKDNRRGGRAGRNTASRSPSAQEMKDGPDKNKENK
jgi:hypothetical protein